MIRLQISNNAEILCGILFQTKIYMKNRFQPNPHSLKDMEKLFDGLDPESGFGIVPQFYLHNLFNV